MITIVEGTDGVGKTEFCRWYADRTGAIYLHAGPPDQSDPFVQYVEPLEHGRDYVLDRWHVGEIVWPMFFERESIFSDMDEFAAVCEALELHDPHYVFIYRDAEDVHAELDKRRPHETDESIHRSIDAQLRYLEVVMWFGLHRQRNFTTLASDFAHELVTRA